VETVVEMVREAEAKGERPSRKFLVERVMEKCGYKRKTAYKLVKDAEKLGLIVCTGWREKAVCKAREAMNKHGDEVISTLKLLLNTDFEVRSVEEPLEVLELKVERALSHVITHMCRGGTHKNCRKSVVVRIVQLWRNYKNLENKRSTCSTNASTLLHKEGGGLRDEVLEEFRMLGWNVDANGYFDDKHTHIYYVLWNTASLMLNGIDCKEIDDEKLRKLLERLCEKLDGKFSIDKLNLIENSLPRVTGVLKAFTDLVKVDNRMRNVWKKLDNEVKRLRDSIAKIIDEYETKRQLKGYCSFCKGEVEEGVVSLIWDLMATLESIRWKKRLIIV
jgi:predicted DNA-binding transcriptional regulator AlpA